MLSLPQKVQGRLYMINNCLYTSWGSLWECINIECSQNDLDLLLGIDFLEFPWINLSLSWSDTQIMQISKDEWKVQFISFRLYNSILRPNFLVQMRSYFVIHLLLLVWFIWYFYQFFLLIFKNTYRLPVFQTMQLCILLLLWRGNDSKQII